MAWAPALGQVASPFAAPGQGAPGSGPATCARSTAAACLYYDDPYHARCGSRGGPGCRRVDGHCAAWRDGFARDCRQNPPGGPATTTPPAGTGRRPSLPFAETDPS